MLDTRMPPPQLVTHLQQLGLATKGGRMSVLDIVLLTGISGSGKSVALNALEDTGYFCVDNPAA